MGEYGVTDKGFIIKRMDRILEELHGDLSRDFGFDTRINPQSFLNVLITSFAGQVSSLWEAAQESYYAKYPATAHGINLDNANQYGGIRRGRARKTYYMLHCTGEEGTYIPDSVAVASDTMPKIRLFSERAFTISRGSFNRAVIRIAALEPDKVYTISLNGGQYSCLYEGGSDTGLLHKLKAAITAPEYNTAVDEENKTLLIEDKTVSRTGELILSDNLTTVNVTVIESFGTEGYGKVQLPNGTITEIVTGVDGFLSVENLLVPKLGRLAETDTEFRHSYLLKSAIRSSGMIGSITSQLLNNVAGVESAVGYENCSDTTDGEGRPPHSIEIIVEGGDEQEIAEVILNRKAGGIQTYGAVKVMVPGVDGDAIPISFNRPEYIYAWFRVVLYGNKSLMPVNYAELAIDSIISGSGGLASGEGLKSQLLHKNIYEMVAGVDYIDIKIAHAADATKIPGQEDYAAVNVNASQRQRILISRTRIEVAYGGSA